MGHGYKHGGTGGGSLNFNVKTYPSEVELKADKPKENTIGVITTTTMTSWVFSATEPTEPEVGMVWISVGNSSGVEFNALKSNTLKVYPLQAQQYENGEWVDKIAFSYIGEEWATWVTYLFNYGKQKYKWSPVGRLYSGSSGETAYAPTATANDDGSVTISLTGSSSTYRRGVYQCDDMIDLTNVKRITLKAGYSGTKNDWGIYVHKDKTSKQNEYTARCIYSSSMGTDVELTVDTSGVSGEYCIFVSINAEPGKTDSITLKEVLMW